jgi:hypothetical protein
MARAKRRARSSTFSTSIPRTPEGTLTVDPDAIAATAAGLRAWIASETCRSPNGAFVAWFDLAGSRRAYDYPEITGYALTYLAGRPSLSKHERAIGSGAADWLVERDLSGNLAARDGWDDNAVYLFDLGMIASGLLSFGRRTHVEPYVETGRRLAGLIADEICSGHFISPVSRHGPPSRRTGWSARGVAHLAKLVHALLLAEGLGDEAGGSASARLIETVKDLQASDGLMRTDDGDTTVMLHPHLYAAEGLWVWACAAGDGEAMECARRAVEWAWAQQLENGGFPRSVPHVEEGAIAVEQSDVTAQAVRLALALEVRSAGVARAIARLIEVARGGDAGLGIVYQPGSPNLHLNTWATLFAAQALAMAIPDAPQISWRQLV